MAHRPYRIIEHTADTGFEVRGSNKKQIFEAAAFAFFHMMWKIENKIENKPITIEVTGGDLKELLVNFLEEFLYLYDAKGLVCTNLEIRAFAETRISARIWLQQFDVAIDRELLGVKAVTYHQLYIGPKDHEWSAQVFLDI
jgi:SHS2 domain-containing protein